MNIRTIIRKSVVLTVTIASIWYLGHGQHGFMRYLDLSARLAKKELCITNLKKTIAMVEDRLNTINNNSAALEKTIRYELCYGQTNELIYVLKDDHKD